MAGKGFNIDALLREKGLGLNLPPFLLNQAQFSVANVLEKKLLQSSEYLSEEPSEE